MVEPINLPLHIHTHIHTLAHGLVAPLGGEGGGVYILKEEGGEGYEWKDKG